LRLLFPFIPDFPISIKKFNLKKFDGFRNNLRRFIQQIYGKIIANADRFPTAITRLTYVAGRLTGKAYELILPIWHSEELVQVERM
jgi:hypothetical protein